MNHIYRTLWSVATQSWQAVPETAKTAGKKSKSSAGGAIASVALSWMLTGVASAQAPPAINQLPTGGTVARGTATINQTATAQAAAMTVNQTSQRAVVNWNTFNIGSNASVNFVQPNAQAVTLNRVSDANPSQIFGRMTSNGQVVLTNANGIYFAPGSSVDVGAITATTHRITDDNFMSGKHVFERNGATGKIINEGNITAALAGYVALLAPEVQNAGVVVARAGTVAMAAGETITLNIDGAGSLAGITTTPSAIATLIENKQAVQAPDGQIILSAVALNKLQAGVIKNSGSLEANSLVSKGGKIYLEGDDITLSSTSKLEAKGATGGGTVLVGGDWQGSGDLRQATKVTMQAGATIDASATDKGDGGKVVLWSDIHNASSVTRANGSIKAESGPNGGDGGKVETSGHYLNVDDIQVSTQSTKGNAGEWLLDPYDVTISSASTATDTLSGGVYTPTDNTSNINATALETALASGNVEVLTTGAGTQTGNITLKNTSALTWNSVYKLKLSASGGITNDSGAGNITMNGAAGTGVEFNQAGNSTYSGVIAGTNAKVIKSGSGTLTLDNQNSFGGGTAITSGTLVHGANYALSSNTTVTVSDGATLQIGGTSTTGTNPLVLNGFGVNGVGALLITGSSMNGINKPITLASASSIVVNKAVGTVNFQGLISGASYTLTLGGSGAGQIALGGAISSTNATALIKEGVGAWTLGAASTFSGDVLVKAGKLTIMSSAALGNSTGKTTVNSGASLSIAGTVSSLAEPIELNGYGYSNTVGALDYSVNNGTNLAYSGSITLSGNTRITTYMGVINPGNTGTLTIANTVQNNNFDLLKTISGGYAISLPSGLADSRSVKTSSAFVGAIDSSVGGNFSSVYGSTPSISYQLYDANASTLNDPSVSGTVVFSGAPTSTSAAGSYSLKYSSGLSSTTYALFPTAVGTTWTVNKANLSKVTATKVYDGLSTVSAGQMTAIEGVNGETFTATAGTASISDKNVAGTKTLTDLSGLTVSSSNGGVLGNYTWNAGLPATGSNNVANITQANLVIAATPSLTGNVYNGSAYTGTYAFTTSPVGNEASGITVTGVATGTNAGTYASSLVATGNVLSNYNTTITNANLVIDPLAVTLSGQMNFSGQATLDTTRAGSTLSATNLVSGDSLNISGTATLAAAAAGTQAITSFGGLSLSNSNYTTTGASGSVTVLAGSSRSSTNVVTKPYVPAIPLLMATAGATSIPAQALSQLNTDQLRALRSNAAPAPLVQMSQRTTTPNEPVVIVPPQPTAESAPRTGVLPVTILQSTNAKPANSGVAFEQTEDAVSLKITTAPAVVVQAPKLAVSDKLTSFTVSLPTGDVVVYEGGLVNNRLVIVATSTHAKRVARNDLKLVLSTAINSLGKDNRVMLDKLKSVLLDLR